MSFITIMFHVDGSISHTYAGKPTLDEAIAATVKMGAANVFAPIGVIIEKEGGTALWDAEEQEWEFDLDSQILSCPTQPVAFAHAKEMTVRQFQKWLTEANVAWVNTKDESPWIPIDEWEANAEYDSDGYTRTVMVYRPKFNITRLAYRHRSAGWIQAVNDEEIMDHDRLTHVAELPERPSDA